MTSSDTATFSTQTSDDHARRAALADVLLRSDRSVEQSDALEAPRQPGDGPRGLPIIDWSVTGEPSLAPQVLQFPKPKPGTPGGWLHSDPLPSADVVVMTWTSSEWDALHYVFSDRLSPLPNNSNNNGTWRAEWYPYRRDFYKIYQALWTRRLVSGARDRPGGAPALDEEKWGSFALVSVGSKKVLLFKSDLHINQDGESLPLEQLVRQIIEDCKPDLLLSVGTAGGVRPTDVLGDVVVTNAAKFRLGDEFESATYNATTHVCETWAPPSRYAQAASRLLIPVTESDVLPPTAHYPAGTVIRARPPRGPQIHLLPNTPILTTDFFEYGTTTNGLDTEGCCVEMDDAVIARVCGDINPQQKYGFLRNLSDPVINGHLPRDLQTGWAVMTYQLKGLYTSYNSAIATWAMIAGS